MAPAKPRTLKNKRTAKPRPTGVANSIAASRKPVNDGIVKKKRKVGGAPPLTREGGRLGLVDSLVKKKKRTYDEKELDIPKLNMITPIGVVKPPGKKKGKVFVDDKESMATIMAIVQAEKEGQIESKVMKARQFEEIRAARLAEAEKKENERKSKLEEIKSSLKKRRKKGTGRSEDVQRG